MTSNDQWKYYAKFATGTTTTPRTSDDDLRVNSEILDDQKWEIRKLPLRKSYHVIVIYKMI